MFALVVREWIMCSTLKCCKLKYVFQFLYVYTMCKHTICARLEKNKPKKKRVYELCNPINVQSIVSRMLVCVCSALFIWYSFANKKILVNNGTRAFIFLIPMWMGKKSIGINEPFFYVANPFLCYEQTLI